MPVVLERRAELRPRSPLRLPGPGVDGVARANPGGGFERLLHRDGEPVVVRATQPGGGDDRVVLVARAASRESCDWAIARMRLALGVDEDLREFHGRFAADPLIGRIVRSRPWLRPARRPEPFEALAWAVCEQLIEFERAAAIQRRLVRRLGRRCPASGLIDAPDARALAAVAPAMLESLDLARRRAVALIAAAREVASGRVDLDDADHERGWRRLRAIRGIGPWTVAVLALHGQGRVDQVPAGDLALRKLVGRLTHGDPRARAEPQEVSELFAPYAPYGGLAATYALWLGVAATPHARPAPAVRRVRPAIRPDRAGTRW